MGSSPSSQFDPEDIQDYTDAQLRTLVKQYKTAVWKLEVESTQLIGSWSATSLPWIAQDMQEIRNYLTVINAELRKRGTNYF